MATYIKVRALRNDGFRRGGYFWPSTETYARVDNEQTLQQIENEAMLSVERVDEGSLSPEQKATADSIADALGGGATTQLTRDEIVDADFPRTTTPPGGGPIATTTPAGNPTAGTPAAPTQPTGTELQGDESTRIAGTNADGTPPKADEPPSETVVASSGGSFFTGDSTAAKKKK